MFNYLLQGLLLGFAYVAPIGIQNLYVINAAVLQGRKRALEVALVTIFFDISLALACFFGVGILIDTLPGFKGVTLLLGSIAVVSIGIMLIRSHPQILSDLDMANHTLLNIVGTCFAITWFNPQAIIDGSLLLGGFRASLPYGMANYFILGVCMASITWFLSLVTVTGFFRSKFNSIIMKRINICCGSIIVFYGFKLGYSFIQFIR
jgi:L-lysine exporter family protein LysE/ArgO